MSQETKEKYCMIRTLPFFASVGMAVFTGGSAFGFSLIGSELRLRTEAQLTPTSQLFVTSFPASAIVSESNVEFPNVESLFDPNVGVPPGFAESLVNVAIDAGADYLEIDFDNVGSRFNRFATGFQNTYVFTFADSTALQITDVVIDPSTNLGLTADRVTFDGNELFVNVQGLSFNPNSFVRVNLTATAIPEPLTLLGASTALGFGTFFKRKLNHSKSTKK